MKKSCRSKEGICVKTQKCNSNGRRTALSIRYRAASSLEAHRIADAIGRLLTDAVRQVRARRRIEDG